MKKLKIATGVLLSLSIIVVVLLSNKAKSAASARSDKLTSIPVTLQAVDLRELSRPFSMVGTIYANNDVAVVSETQGRVTQVFVKAGDFVEAGTVLVRVDDEIKQAAMDLARANYEKSKRDLERNDQLFEDRTITESQFEQGRLAFQAAEHQFTIAKRQLEDTRITTPISGYVTERRVNIGTMVMPGMSIANVVDVSKLKVKLNLGEKDAFRVEAGEKVRITTEVYPGVEFIGKVGSVSAKADEAHTYPVEIELANSLKHPLRSGMFGLVHFAQQGETTAMAVSRDAIVGSIKEPQVYVVHNGVATLRRVVVDGEYGGVVAVRSGLDTGDKVVVSGHTNLTDGAEVTVMK